MDAARDDAGNLADLVRAAAERHPDKIALIHRRARQTWGELDARVDALAAALRGRGLATGDRVALLLANTPHFVACYFAVLRAGLVAVPVNTAYTAAEVGVLLGDSGARLAVCGRAAAPVVSGLRESASALEVVVVTDLPEPGLAPGLLTLDALELEGRGAGPQNVVAGGEDLAVLLFTSGTSGRPKGAMLSHRALLANLEQCARIEPPVMTEDDVVLLVLPLFHVYGLGSGLGMVARTGATALLVERFDPVDTLAEVAAEQVTNIPGAPPMYVAWSMLPDLAPALSSVRLAVSGAAPLPPAVLAAVRERTGHQIFEGYGLTEAAPALTSTLCSETVKPGSVGRPVPGVELRLLDEQGDEVVEDDPGEIVVRGRNLFSGYWPDGEDGPDADGWFATGDVAYADADGDLFLVDRRKDLILVSGFNVYPREVEDVLLTHPDIADAAVVAIKHPYTGEAVKAFVVPVPGARLTADDVVEHCARRLARFKCPRAVAFVTELPHTVTGKVAKRDLREEDESRG